MMYVHPSMPLFHSGITSRDIGGSMSDISRKKGADKQDVLIVDVREPDEVSLGSIPSSVNLPFSELKDALSPNFGEGDFKKVSPSFILSTGVALSYGLGVWPDGVPSSSSTDVYAYRLEC